MFQPSICVRYSSDEAMKKGRWPQRRQVTFMQARRGDSRSNDQAEGIRDQGGFIFKGRFCRNHTGRFSRADEQGWGVPGWRNLPGASGGTSSSVVIPEDRWFNNDRRSLSSFSRPEAFEIFIFFSRPEDSFTHLTNFLILSQCLCRVCRFWMLSLKIIFLINCAGWCRNLQSPPYAFISLVSFQQR